MEDEQGVDATLAPIAGRAEIEFRRDTSIYSSCLLLRIFNAHVSTARYTLMTRSGRGSRPGLSGCPVRVGVHRRPGTGRCRRVRAVMLPTHRRLSGCPTSPRQGVVDAVKLTGLQRAVLMIWREN